MATTSLARPRADFATGGWRFIAAGAAALCTGLVLWGFLAGPLTSVRLVLAIVVVTAFWTDIAAFLPRYVFLPGVTVAAVALSSGAGNVATFIPVIACGEAAITGTAIEAVLELVVAVAAICVGLAVTGADFFNNITWPLGCVFATGTCMVVRTLLDLNVRLRAAQEMVAEQAIVDERRRLAREIHDVIAHSMTVTMLHVSGARLSLQDDPPDVAEALAALTEAEHQGRASLSDIRRTVGLLNTPADSGLAAPEPAGADVEDLLATYREAGVPLAVRLDGDVRALSPAVGLAAYRILQESLANAAKHAPGAEVHVNLHVGRRKVEIRVTNGLPPPGATSPGSLPAVPGGGRGTAGMVERARSLGGRVDAGPRGAGWRVEARLPLHCAPMP